jgi:hypothetical protein
MLIALIYALPLLIEEGQELEAFNVASQIICYAFALQGLIHLIGFLNNDFGDYILSLQPQDVQDRVFDPGRNIKVYRAYALTGSAFFELPCAYGVAAILFMRLKLIEDGYRYFPKHIDYIIFALILAGIMLSGRIGFIGIILSGFLYFIFVSDPIVILNRIFRRSIVFVPVFLFFYFFIFSESQRVSFEEELFPFAFEFYYNFRDTGKLRTVSSDATIEAFYFPLKENTLVWGHGTGSRELLDIYNFTDAGYMRTLMYGGIPLLLILIFYQYLYFHIPMSIAREDKTRENNVNFYCFLLLFLYMLMVHYKDNALGLQHITETLFLFAGSTCFIQYGENRNLE